MTLRDLQQALAERLTDRAGTTGSQQPDLLTGFDNNELQQSRETLIRKRLSQIAGLMPGTRQALKSEYTRLCRQFLTQHHFHGHLAPQLDAIHFASWLEDQPDIYPWQRELGGWEAMHIQWSISRWLFRWYAFNYDLHESRRSGREPARRRSLWLAVRLGKRGSIVRLLS